MIRLLDLLNAKRADISGQSFGRLTALRRVTTKGRTYWECRCICGRLKAVRVDHLRSGKIRSCQCLRTETSTERVRTHGWSKSPTWTSWASAKARCRDEGRHDYGGRGIAMCARWRNGFDAFLEDMGPRPNGRSLDRIDNDGPYAPGNCRWSTRVTQANNTSVNRRVLYEGQELTIAEWARSTGIKYHTLRHRLESGWAIDRAFTAPVRARR